MKRELWLRRPLMNAAGTLGLVPDPRAPLGWDSLGAFVTDPISRLPRSPAREPRLQPVDGGFLLHSGLPNPGLRLALRRCARRWASAALPVIVHLMADAPAATARMVQRLEGRENILAVELGFPPEAAPVEVRACLQAALGELPVIVNLPAADAAGAGPELITLGAAAISFAAPRSTFVEKDGTEISGRLYGPGLFPRTLEATRACAALGLPVIAAGGVYTAEQAQALLSAGALAVQLDAVLWKQGGLPAGKAETGAA